MSKDISKKIRSIRAKEGMTVHEFAEFLGLDPDLIVDAEENGVVSIKILERVRAVCPEHVFSLVVGTFENESKIEKFSAAFEKRFTKKKPLSLTNEMLSSEFILKRELNKYIDEIESSYKQSFGYKLLLIMKAEKKTYEDLHSLIDLPVSSLKKYTGSHVTPTIDVAQKICSAYPYYMWYLMQESMDNAPEGQITP